MVKISGKHFIFTRVEQEYSPKNVGGFQVYYASKDLPIEDLKLLENSVKCFIPSDNTIVRKQFFRLPSQSFAFVHTVVESHPEISDRSQRGGVFLAHGIIIDSNHFSQIFFNPFLVFDGFRFLTSAEEMVNQFKQLEYKEQQCRIEVDPYAPIADSEKFTGNALELYQLATKQKKQIEPLLLVGQNIEIERFLRAIIQFAPISVRSLCTFDTNVDNCQLAIGNFWAVGSSFPKDQIQNTLNVSRCIPNLQSGSGPKGDLYYDWLQFVIRNDGKDAYRHAVTAQTLADVFVNRNSFSKIKNLNPDGCELFFLAHEKKITQYIIQTIAKLTSANVAQDLINYILSSQPDYRELLSIAASKSVSPSYLSPLIRNWVLSCAPDFKLLKNDDWIALQNFAKDANDWVILFWASALAENDKLKQSSLANMGESDYLIILLLLFKPIYPKDYVSSSNIHMRQLMPKVIPVLRKLNNDVFVDFVSEMFKMKAMDFLDELAPKVNSLDNKLLTQLEARMPSLPDRSLFMQSVREKRMEFGRPDGIRGLFYRTKK